MTLPALYGHLAIDFQKMPNGNLITVTTCRCCGQEITRRELDITQPFRVTDANAREDAVREIDHVEHCPMRGAPREALQ